MFALTSAVRSVAGAAVAGAVVLSGVAPVRAEGQSTPRRLTSYHFQCGGRSSGNAIPLASGTVYSPARGYGFRAPFANGAGAACAADQPFLFDVALPEGNYDVSVTVGHSSLPGETTVRAESRRLMLERVRTKAGQLVTRHFTVNVRTAAIAGGDSVRLKSREIGSATWDDRLTLEFTGVHPSVREIDIRPAMNPVTVFLAGNSTVVDQTGEPWAAWGQMIPRFFKPGAVVVANHAESGETLKAFIGERRLAKLLSTIKKGDYLFIEFAHNDQKPGSSYLEPFTTYKEYLRRYIAEARSRGATPVLVTSMHRRQFDSTGHIVNTLGDYPAAVRQVAAEDQVALVDLNAMSKDFYEALGPERAKKAFVHYPAGSYPGQIGELKDDTHFNNYGAYELARMVVEGLRKTALPLAAELLPDLPAFDPSHPDAPEQFALPPSPVVAAPEPRPTARPAAEKYPFQNPQLSIEARVSNILSLMTLDEKVAALGTNPSVPRLGIRGSSHIEGLHGVALGGPGVWGGKGLPPVPTTQFPQAVGLGETWDPELLRQAAAVEGYEARYTFNTDTLYSVTQRGERRKRTGLVVRSPNTDLARDPRWGRSEESYGEDPYLVGTMASAFAKGLQGDHPTYWLTASLMKHFLANSNEDTRDSSSSDFDERLLREYYSVPFRMGVAEGRSRSYMAAYNARNGVPMTAHPMMKSMTMHEWGVDGIVCTDAGALTNMVTKHHYFPTMEEAAAGALHAGINQFLDRYQDGVNGALAKKLVNPAEIDENLRGVYRVMIRLGLLDPPKLVPFNKIGGRAPAWDRAEHKALARKVTQESIVLLKNANHVLPLDRTRLRSVAVIGPYADIVALDLYSGTPPYAVSALEGIKNKVGGGVQVAFAHDNADGAAVRIARSADVAIVVVGNHPMCNAGWLQCPVASDGKEAVDRRSISLEQEELVKQVHAVNPRTVMVLIASFPYAIPWSNEHVPAIVHMAHNSQEQGNALADVLFGDYNPAGRLVTTWPKSLEQLPPLMDYDIRHGRTYMYAKEKPLYPFGYGLSYTTFDYRNLKRSAARLAADGSIAVSVDVRNSGTRAGDEVVQLYLSHEGSAVPRPVQELKGFRRIALKPGERATVTFTLKGSDLAWWNVAKGAWEVEVDKVRLLVGASSADIRLRGVIDVSPQE